MNENEKRSRPAEESYYYEDEIDLAELVGVLWRRRWFMLGVIIFFVGLAVAYCFITTPRYEIVAQLRPGITGFDARGNPVRDWTPKDIESWFARKGYPDTVAGLLGDNTSIPIIRASSNRQAKIVTVSLYWPDSAQGKQILGSIIDVLASTGSEGIQQRLAVSRRQIEEEIHETESELEHIPIERGRFDDQIAREKNKIQVIDTELDAIKKDKAQTREVIERVRGQIDTINQNTAKLMQLRQQMVTGESDKFALLMYSNVIQQNITYVTGLEQKIADMEKELNSYRVKEAEKSDEIRSAQIKIKDLQIEREQELSIKEANLQKKILTIKAKLDALLPVEVVKSPFSSSKPVKPAKTKIVAIAFVLGCFLAVVTAFLR
ncbi:MAG: Wzz/FepE/Etk N-terminal domain-containing protein, partial [Deltaproteobacteria bacterium]|nr:Wzz/FepE/Etk N-terminal domain-containing protein [Deltaproteobacteria bacterium]